MSGRNYSDYGSWKLISYLMPFLIAIFLSLINRYFIVRKDFLFFVSGILCMGPSLLWLANPGIMSNQFLVELSQNRQLEKFGNLNVDLDPNFETMLATTVLPSETKSFLRSQSYLTTSSDLNSCSLVRNTDTRYPFKRQLNALYALGSTDSAICDQYIKVNKYGLMATNTSLNRRLGDGWWEEENWGTFMRREIASIPLEISLRHGDSITVKFLPLNRRLIEIFDPKFSINNIPIKLSQRDLINGQVTITSNDFSLSTNSRYVITVQVAKVVAGMYGGNINDNRPVGIGLENIQFIKGLHGIT